MTENTVQNDRGVERTTVPDEETPLLANSTIAPTSDPDVAPATTATIKNNNDDDDEDEDEHDQPLPRTQIFLLCYTRMIEPIAFFSIFPFVNKMVQDNGHLTDADVGFYSGLIESLFSLTQMCVLILWGRMADRFGRKPTLVVSLYGLAFTVALFGFGRTIWQMILFRCMAGLCSGSIVTVRTMLTELSTPRTQAQAFSYFAFAGNLGIFVGPLLGGALADPATQYPSVFGGVAFLENYPYALATMFTGFVGLTAATVALLFINETRVPASSLLLLSSSSSSSPSSMSNPKTTSDSTTTTIAATSSSSASSSVSSNNSRDTATNVGTATTTGSTPNTTVTKIKEPLSTLALLRSPGVPMVLYIYAHIMLLAFAYTAVVPVFWFTPVTLGGFGFTPLLISIFMGMTGLAQAIWLLLVFPPLQSRLGTGGVLRVCANAYPVFFLMCPLLSLLLKSAIDKTSKELTVLFWIIAPLLLCLGVGVSMSFTAIQLALNNISPGYESLGTLNALALTLVSGIRAFSPWLFASIFAAGARSQVLNGYLIWLVLVVLALGFTLVIRWLPEKAAGMDLVSNNKDKRKKAKGNRC